ncbi:MAG: hypothetical protein KF777_25275 [Planctomycetaceae bacterium]|nr:hypothetical protein [Planctomycetaceae bacterium]
MIRQMRLLLILLLLSVLALAEPFPAAGVWKVGHGDGTELRLTLHADGRAESDWEGQYGSWHWQGDRLVVEYTDGWADIISATKDGYEKVSYKPGADRNGPPSNRTTAVRLP